MRHVITGHTGFLGSHLLRELQKDPTNQFMLVNAREGFAKGSFQRHQIRNFAPNYVWNFAGEIYEQDKMMQANVVDLLHLLDTTKRLQCRFVHIGSSSEYGKKEHPMSEEDILSPRTIYECTKSMGTMLCQGYANTQNRTIIVARPFSVYGEGDKKHKFIPTLLRKFKDHEKVEIYPGSHDFIHVDDFIANLLEIANVVDGFEIVNIGSGHQTTNQEVFNIFAKEFGYKIPVDNHILPFKSYDSDFWVSNTKKMSKITKEQYTPRTLQDGLKELIQAHR